MLVIKKNPVQVYTGDLTKGGHHLSTFRKRRLSLRAFRFYILSGDRVNNRYFAHVTINHDVPGKRRVLLIEDVSGTSVYVKIEIETKRCSLRSLLEITDDERNSQNELD